MTGRTHTPEDVQKIMESWRDSASDYERGFIDGMQKQMQSSVDKAVNAMSQCTWVGLTDEEKQEWIDAMPHPPQPRHFMVLVNAIESELKEKNNG